MRMSSNHSKKQSPSVRGLIELQRRLADSKNPFLRRIGALLAAGVLDRHLDGLNDRQIGQLMFDHVGRELGSPSLRRRFAVKPPGVFFAPTSGASQKKP